MVKFNQNPFFNTIHIRTKQIAKFYHISTKTGLFKVGQHAPPFTRIDNLSVAEMVAAGY